MEWEVYTETYWIKERYLDDGSGPSEPCIDWVLVTAPSWREAMMAGRKRLEEEYPKGYIYEQRRDGLFPYSGIHCRLFKPDEYEAPY